MARTVDQLPAASVVNPTDNMLVSQLGIAKKATQSQVATGGAGITELTTDVTAGPGAGTQVATVEGIQGTPVSPAAPAPGDTLVLVAGVWTPQAPSASTVGPAQAIFVDPVGGNDGTGTRGRADLPFLTINAAVAAVAADDDCVVLAPGIHSVTATLPEPAFARYSIVGYGREVTRVNFVSGGLFDPMISIGATVTNRLTLRDFTLACDTGDFGILADGTTAGGAFMYGGLELTRMRFCSITSTPTYGFILNYANRIVIDDVIVHGYVQFDTCWAAPGLSFAQSIVRGLAVGISTYIKWDDDVAAAFGFPMSREPMRFRECYLGAVQLDGQPSVAPERCTYFGLTSFNPLNNSVTGIASVWWETECIVDGLGGAALIDFTAAQAILDVVVSPAFAFQRQAWRGPVFATFERVAEANGRTTVRISDLDGPGSFSAFGQGLGIDGYLAGSSAMPTIFVTSTGTFTPSVWRPTVLFGPLAPGLNIIPFPWGLAAAGINWIQVTPTIFVPGEVLTAGPSTASDFAVDAVIGGSFCYVTLGWGNGY